MKKGTKLVFDNGITEPEYFFFKFTETEIIGKREVITLINGLYVPDYVRVIDRPEFKMLDCGCCGIPFKTWDGYINQGQDVGYGICAECQDI